MHKTRVSVITNRANLFENGVSRQIPTKKLPMTKKQEPIGRKSRETKLIGSVRLCDHPAINVALFSLCRYGKQSLPLSQEKTVRVTRKDLALLIQFRFRI